MRQRGLHPFAKLSVIIVVCDFSIDLSARLFSSVSRHRTS